MTGKAITLCLLLSSIITTTFAQCQAVGFLATQSISGKNKRQTQPTDVSQNFVYLYKNGQEIGYYDPGMFGNQPCGDADYTDPCTIDSSLPEVVTFFGNCLVPKWNSCVLNYGSQVHVQGTPQAPEFQYYGIGVNTEANCTIDFAC